jgi:nucleoside-diphosphate-sugar epimerase
VASPDSSEFPRGGVLITGATGFVGRAVVRALLAAGLPPARLRCVVRSSAAAERSGVPRESVRLGDLGHDAADAALREAAHRAEVVLHLAGAVKAWRRRGYDDVNRGGTARLVAALQHAAPAAHVVLVSSLAAAGPSVDGVGSDALPDRCHPVSAYGESKRRGELEVVRSGLAWTIVRPPVVYGAGDGATQLLFRQACAPVAPVPRRPAPLSAIHVRDVVEALRLAIARRPAGAVLPLDGPERTDTHAFVRAIAAACGRRARLLPVPLPLAAVAASVCDLFAGIVRRAAYFSGDKVREIAAPGWVADGRPAQRLLGFAPRTGLAEGLAEVARAEGLVRAATSATA